MAIVNNLSSRGSLFHLLQHSTKVFINAPYLTALPITNAGFASSNLMKSIQCHKFLSPDIPVYSCAIGELVSTYRDEGLAPPPTRAPALLYDLVVEEFNNLFFFLTIISLTCGLHFNCLLNFFLPFQPIKNNLVYNFFLLVYGPVVIC